MVNFAMTGLQHQAKTSKEDDSEYSTLEIDHWKREGATGQGLGLYQLRPPATGNLSFSGTLNFDACTGDLLLHTIAVCVCH
jgi:hypothetical protein